MEVAPLVAFAAGAVSVLSPCVLPLIPAVLAVALNSRAGPFLVIGGMIISFVSMGVLASVFGAFIGSYMLLFKKIASLIILAFGIVLLVERLELVFSRLMGKLTMHPMSMEKKGYLGMFFLGISLGIVWIPCTGPILGSILTYVAIEGNIVYGGFLLLLYSLGIAVPMIIIGTIFRESLYKLKILKKSGIIAKKVAGAVLIVIGITYFLGIEGYLMEVLYNHVPEVEIK